MESKENAAHSAPHLRRLQGKRKALAELPINEWRDANGGSAPRPSKPRTRSAARAEAEAEEARKRREAEDADAARGAGVGRLLDPKRQDAGAAQAAVAPYLRDIDRYLRSLEVRVSRLHLHFFPR
jgi:cyclin A